MPQFTILTHNHPFLHWDLLLDTQQELIPAWRLLQQPLEQKLLSQKGFVPASSNQQTIPAERIPDHRRIYLDYSGQVSQNRGEVQQWDSGFYIPIMQSDNCWELRLEGKRIRGFASLYQLAEQTPQHWQLKLVFDDNQRESW